MSTVLTATLHVDGEAVDAMTLYAEPLVTAPWGDEFGMLLDRFGIVWMINISGAATA